MESEPRKRTRYGGQVKLSLSQGGSRQGVQFKLRPSCRKDQVKIEYKLNSR
jgi:hypothetical protein